jgi:hypothetical protein
LKISKNPSPEEARRRRATAKAAARGREYPIIIAAAAAERSRRWSLPYLRSPPVTGPARAGPQPPSSACLFFFGSFKLH